MSRDNSAGARLKTSLEDAKSGRVTRHDSVESLMQWLDAWPFAPLGEVCKTTSGGTPSRRNPNFFDGSIPWVKSGELPDGPVFDVEESISEEALRQSSAKLFPSGTLLIALYGATVGKLGILTKPAATNQAVCGIFPPDEIDTKFLFWFLRFKRTDLVAQAVGGAQPNISQGIIRGIEIPMPPLDQQKRIVAEIEKQFSRLDEAVANLKRVKANLKRYKAAVLKAAIEGRLVETEAERARREGRSYETGAQLLQRILETRRSQRQGKGKYKEPAAPDTTDLPELPEGWVWSSVDQLSDVVRGASPRPAGDPKYFGGTIPWITVGPITAAVGAFLRAVPESVTELGKANSRYIEAGTLLLTNSGATLGVPKVTLIGGCINDGVAALLGVEDPLKMYLLHLLSSHTQSLRQLNQGAAQPNLNTTIIRAILVPLPGSAEQHRIVDEIERRHSHAVEAEAQVNANILRAAQLRHSILQKAFAMHHRSDQ